MFYASDGAQPTSYNATQGATYLDTYSFCNSSTLVVLDRPIPAPPIPPTNLSSVEGLEVGRRACGGAGLRGGKGP